MYYRFLKEDRQSFVTSHYRQQLTCRVITGPFDNPIFLVKKKIMWILG